MVTDISTGLNRRFRPFSDFQEVETPHYRLLPFQFIALDSDGLDYLATNWIGEPIFCNKADIEKLIHGRLAKHTAKYDDFKAKHFLYDDESSVALDLLAAKFFSQQQYKSRGTSLFMFVTTLRCEHTCKYCQVSRRTQDSTTFDMSAEQAQLAIDFMFQSPSPVYKVEFQGGESLLNFPLIQYIVKAVNQRNDNIGKKVSFVITTNLACLTQDHLDFCKLHGVDISTSLDGPAELHNFNRPRPGKDSHKRAVDGIHRVRQELGPHAISALMTTTAKSLKYPKEIVDEYLEQGFSSVFLRPISPYGFAIKTKAARAYEAEQWLDFYFQALEYIIELNRRGTYFREAYATLLLKKIYGQPTYYVDLQSPSGIGIGGIIFNYNGKIYASDEGRMLAEMGDETFCLGHLEKDSYAVTMKQDRLWEPLRKSLAESSPQCHDCAVRPFCGSEPVFHHATQGDVCGHKATSDFCNRNMKILKYLFGQLSKKPEERRILESWI